MTDDYDEPVLVARAVAGDADAFGELWRHHHIFVYRYLLRRCTNAYLAEDLAQDVFVRAWVAFRAGRFTWQDKSVGAYLVTIAGNLLRDHFKSGRGRLEILVAEVTGIDPQTGAPPAVDGPEVLVERAVTVAAVRAAVARLTPPQREVVELRFFEDLSVAEVCDRLGVADGSVKARAWRGYERLRKELAA